MEFARRHGRHAAQASAAGLKFSLTPAGVGGRISIAMSQSDPNQPSRNWRAVCAVMVALAGGVFLGCAALNPPPPTPQQRAERIEPMLAAAGFKMLVADTPAKVASLDALPAATVRYYTNKKGQRQYWFADPFVCKCLYLGDDAAYGRYENLKLQKQIADEQQQAAQENLEAAQDMELDGLGPWGFTPGIGFGVW